MKFLRLLRAALYVFDIEDEIHLAYLYGCKINQHEYIRNRPCKRPGLLVRCLYFFRYLQKNYKRNRKKSKCVDYFFYAGTENQLKSLMPTIHALEKKRMTISICLGRNISFESFGESVNVLPVCFNLKEILIASFLFVVKAPRLYFKLKHDKNYIGINHYFDMFCQSYIYAPLFLSLLNEIKPFYVIQSNDHNLPNRSLRSAAEVLCVKSVFMQHGAGTGFQPPLNFNYAFLNGEQALNEYAAKYPTNLTPEKHNINPIIFLSGQKKQLVEVQSPSLNGSKLIVGVGVSSLNEFIFLESLLKKFKGKQIRCVVRTHPGQAEDFLESLRNFIKENNYVSYSNPKADSLTDFFSKCSILIAANTSLHLDAGLSGIPSYYYELSKSSIQEDYFGFEKSGLIENLPENIFDMSNGELKTLTTQPTKRIEAVRYFSESYKTRWEGKEGDLVAETLCMIRDNKPLGDLYAKVKKSENFKEVYRIATHPLK